MKKIGVLGTGYVGLALSIAFARKGHPVIAMDRNSRKVETLRAGNSVEKEFEAELADPLIQTNIHFTDKLTDLISCKNLFVCIETPSGKHGLNQSDPLWTGVKEWVSECLQPHRLIIKSTAAVGTGDALQQYVDAALGKGFIEVFVSPEFMREGSAMKDMLQPDRIILGSDESAAGTKGIRRLLSVFDAPVLNTSRKEAELIKLSSNAFLATKISFINQLANYSDKIGTDIEVIAQGMGMDARIGQSFFKAGIGFGGPCLEKDLLALSNQLHTSDIEPILFNAVADINGIQKEWPLKQLERMFHLDDTLTIAVWGLTFKGGTSDLRNSPALENVLRLVDRGVRLRLYDPAYVEIDWIKKAAEAHPRLLKESITWLRSAADAVEGSDALLILSDWDEFKAMDFGDIVPLFPGKTIIDGRNLYQPGELAKWGLKYQAVGKRA